MIKIYTLLCFALVVTGCATKQRIDIDSLKTMQIDCKHKDEQILFLESQKTTPDERMAASFTAAFSTESRAIVNREYDAIANNLLHQLRSSCH